MKDIPIIFSGPMVRALLDGRKTMTRRLAWRTKWNEGGHVPDGGGGQMDYVEPHEERIGPSSWQKVKPGDRLWVKETHWRCGYWDRCQGKRRWVSATGPATYLFDEPRATVQAIAPHDLGWHKWPSILLPRVASRLTLVVTATKIERLQQISDADAKAEGIVEDDGSEPDIWYVPGSANAGWKIEQASRPAPVFRSLWIALHGRDSWAANPQVRALTFTVHKQNIDTLTV